MKSKKLAALGLTAVLSLGLLTACSGGSDDTNETPAGSTPPVAESGAPAADSPANWTSADALATAKIAVQEGTTGDALVSDTYPDATVSRFKAVTACGMELLNGRVDCVVVDSLPAQKLVDALRAAKDDGEIALMTKAQEITDRAFSEILKFIQPGMTEQEIAAKLQYDMLRFGAEKMSFDPIVVSGPNGSLPHGIPSAKQVQQGEFITMDFGCKYGGYCSDMTRTVALGEPTGEMQKVYQTVLEAQLAGIAVTKAGVPGKSIDAAARKVIEDAGYGEYFGHGYGHSLGIEIHESPNANTREETLLPVGAVVSAEPGIYLPGKFGVRIEDVTVLTADGCMVLTKSPKELIIL